jgi:acetyl-CoA carboxylase biotin carboxyl carrier protein
MSAEKSHTGGPSEKAKAASTGPAASQDIFDVRKIRRLLELMKEFDLNQMDLRQGEMRVQLQRGGLAGADATAVPMASSVVRAAPAAAMAVPPEKAAPPAEDEKHFHFIKSPMVGTFYAASDPESPPYVKVGDHVGPDTTVCIVEAMKVFNEIQAECSGKVVAVLVQNGEPVEFGQPMFKIDTRG